MVRRACVNACHSLVHSVRRAAGQLAAWSTSDAPRTPIYAAAVFIGLAMYIAVYGIDHLLGASTYWQTPQVDERMALMGYRYFMLDDWHWPVFVSDAVNVPYRKSVAFLDCIPIWALLNKAIATVIPPWKPFSMTAYLGMWHALVYVLQACLGVACMRALGHRSWRLGVASAFAFLAVPTWIFRYAHPALSAHFLILWALYLYLRTPARAPLDPRRGVVLITQLVISALVTPYHATFSLVFLGATLLRTRHPRSIAIWLPLALAAVVLASWFAGYFAAEAGRPQWGFEWNSANALSWLVPPRSGIVGNAQWIANVNPTPWQYEGYAYLGLGYLGLTVLCLRVAPVRAALARHRVLAVLVLGCAVFALSNRVFVGSHELVRYPLPHALGWIQSQFRSPGRFVWIPTYVLVVFLLHRAYTALTGRRFAIVAIAIVVQLVDASGDWSLQRTLTRGPHERLLDPARWRPIVHAHREVAILPPYSCVYHEQGRLLDLASMEIQLLASERALPINGTYSARDRRRCKREQAAWPTMSLEPETLYVVLLPARVAARRLESLGAHCRDFTYGEICSTKLDVSQLNP